MQNGAADFPTLIARVRAGSQEAAWELITRYGDLVFRVVRSRLPRDLRRAFDSEDFVQVAWGSIFRHRSRLDRFETPDEFVAFLATVTANKVRVEIRRRYQQKKHNLNRERALQVAVTRHAAAAEPTPSQLAMARERWFRLLDNQPSHYKEVVQLRYLGYTSPEIADHVGVDEGTVRRILRKILSHSKHEQET